jgi:hypothetical protein
MRIRGLVQTGLLLAIGYILHFITPGLAGGMKPDFILTMLFIAIMLERDFKTTLVAGIGAGILAALSSTFPAGQIPNLIDKFLTALFVFGLVKLGYGRLNDKLFSGTVGLIGTLFSGFVFLGSAVLFVGLPAPFSILVLTVVLPAAAINLVTIAILYPLVKVAKRFTHQEA